MIISIANAPAARRYGNSSTLATAISFLTGLNVYQDERTKKNNKEPKKESLEIEFLIELIKKTPKDGGSHRIRTCDQLVKSQLLYQLS